MPVPEDPAGLSDTSLLLLVVCNLATQAIGVSRDVTL